MSKFLSLFFFLILSLTSVSAATYYVRTDGNNLNTGLTDSSGGAWQTITKAAATVVAGDTVIVGNGDYNEEVYEQTAGTGSGTMITYQAQNRGLASLRAFRLGGNWIKLDGFTLNKYSGVSNTWSAAVLINSGVSNCRITNCTIKDLPYVIASDFTFDIADQSVNTATGNFVTAGFVPGSKVYLGASGYNLNGVVLWYANHDTTWTVATVTANKMTLTAGSAAFLADSGTGYWGIVRAASNNDGFGAITSMVSGGVGSSNITVDNNTISNWPGHAVNIIGTDWLMENNTLTELKGSRAFSYSGSNHVIRRNKIYNCKNILYYTAYEIDNALIHPPGTGWYDYQVGMFSGTVTAQTTHQNVLIEENWFENIENQMGRVDDGLVGAFDITFRRNVFIGMSDHFSGGRDGMKWIDNTFFWCSWEIAPHPLSIGGSSTQTGYEISGNIFLACGKTGLTETVSRGWYNVNDNVISPIIEDNFVSSEEVTGYLAKTGFPPAEGTTGGDPVFYNVTDFDGPDNLIFTDDDGLKVLANSPAAAYGGGALGVRAVTTNQPVAHFRITTPNGWIENPSDTYDPAWLELYPTTRPTKQRPFGTPVKIGEASLPVVFNAEKSISGIGGATTNTAISSYSWNFGDGSTSNSHSPTISHTYTTGGDFTVTLTVTNIPALNSHTTSMVYRVASAPTGFGIIDVPSEMNLATAMTSAAAGDTIRLAAGIYDQVVTTARNGTASNRITIDGQGVATIRQIRLRHDYITVKNLRVTGQTAANSYHIYMEGGDHLLIDNCDVDANYVSLVQGIGWSTSRETGSSDCIIQNTTVQRCRGASMVAFGGSRNIFRNNHVKDGYLIDFIRLFGAYQLIHNNVFENNLIPTVEYPANGNHPDFIQIFGNNGESSYGHIIEKNFIKNIENGGLSQMNATGMPDIRDITFKNNVFADIANTASCTITGVKWYNNTFYRCNFNNKGHVLSFGLRPFDSLNQLWDGHPEYALTQPDTLSGDIIPGVWYKVFRLVNPKIGGIVTGVLYKVSASGTGRLVYNGTEYAHNTTFTGLAGINDWSAIGSTTSDINSVSVFPVDGLIYNGKSYNQSGTMDLAAFLAVEGVTTYTRPSAQLQLRRQVVDYAHGCEAKNNVFLACGDPTNYQNGWYAFDDRLLDVSADYNYVAKTGFLPPRIDELQRDVGSGNTDSTKWWEDHGVGKTQIDPKFNDFTNYDFRLVVGSPLIDAGTDITGVNSDYKGTVRPLVVRTDVGSDEYDDGNPPPDPEPGEDPPAAPTNLLSTEVRQTNVTLGWDDNSTTETSFELQRSLNGTLWGNAVSVGASVTSYQVTGLTASTTYYWRIRAVSTVGNSGWSNTYSVATSDPPPPDPTDPPIAPSGLAAEIIGSNRASLTWVDNSDDEENFELARSLDGIAWVTTSFPAANTITFESTGLSPTTTYYWRIRAISGDGLLLSAWSNVATGTTPVLVPETQNRQRSGALLTVPTE